MRSFHKPKQLHKERKETLMETIYAGIRLESPVVNAAGTCKTVEDVREFAKTPVGAITLGSITIEPRSLNPGNTYWMDPEGYHSLNSLGLPNGGKPFYKGALPEMRKIAHAAGKPLVVSVAGFSPEEYATLAEFVGSHGADIVELNLGCPNVWSEGKGQKPIASYEPTLVAQILKAIGTPITLKLSPLPPNILSQVAAVINAFPNVLGVCCSNTWPNGFSWEGGKTAITPGGGKAGFAGPGFKGIALGQVVQFKELLRPDIDIMGAGGVQSGRDVQDYLRAGAKAVSINTAFTNRGFRVFSNILMGLSELAPVT